MSEVLLASLWPSGQFSKCLVDSSPACAEVKAGMHVVTEPPKPGTSALPCDRLALPALQADGAHALGRHSYAEVLAKGLVEMEAP